MEPVTRNRALSALLLTCLALACATRPAEQRIVAATGAAASPPLFIEGSAYEAAARVQLPPVPPGEYEGLHNVYVLSESILSGAEPQGPEALKRLASWGVRTILSVDGKVPDFETAAALGMRYVHVPIRYKGIDADELLRIAKTFRELERPFYVHCFHGKHRGPAAAAVGRVVLDQAPRELAIAEMRQWCATSPKYEGLFATVATADMPGATRTRAFEFDFAPARSFDGVRAGMVLMARKWDLVKLGRGNAWAVDPEHPDVDPLREATQLHQLFERLAEVQQPAFPQDDFRAWMEQGRDATARLVRALPSSASPDDPPDESWRAEADEAFALVADSCASCHAAYRN